MSIYHLSEGKEAATDGSRCSGKRGKEEKRKRNRLLPYHLSPYQIPDGFTTNHHLSGWLDFSFLFKFHLKQLLDIHDPPACIPPIASRMLLLFIATVNSQVSTGEIQATRDSQHARYLIQSHALNANAPFRPLWGMPNPFAPLGPANVSCCSHVEWQNIA